MTGYAVAHLDEIEEFADAGCHYRPIRHHLGITAFGATAWTARAAGDLVINEHDEDDPTADQELFLVLRGHAVFELDADRLGVLVAAAPQYPMLSYNLACCESLSGRTSDALDHLRHAIEMSAEFRDSAKNDSDLDPIRDEPAFTQLISD